MSKGWGTKSGPVSPTPPPSFFSSVSSTLYLLMKHNPLKSTSTGICQVITSLVRLPASTLCYSTITGFCWPIWLNVSFLLRSFFLLICPFNFGHLPLPLSVFFIFLFLLLNGWGSTDAQILTSGQMSFSVCRSLVHISSESVYYKTIPWNTHYIEIRINDA